MLETVAEECGETRLLPSDANDPLVFTITEKAGLLLLALLHLDTIKTLC